MNYSVKKVGFTSAMKMGFVFDSHSESSNSPNHVYTQFKASENAVSLIERMDDAKVMTVEVDGEIVVLSVDEAKEAGLAEVTLKVVDKNTENAHWIAV